MSNGASKRCMGFKSGGLILLSTILAVACVGCGVNSGTWNKEQQPVTYWVQNPIEIEEIQVDSYQEDLPNSSFMKLHISGLKDKEIEKKINERIDEVYNLLLKEDLPPYRGIKKSAHVGTDPEKDPISIVNSKNVYMYEFGNFNNILSICANVSGSCEGIYYSDMIPLNLDLNSGDEITLSQIFKDGCDYETLINDRMATTLNQQNSFEMDYGFVQVAPFKGIHENQKFLLSESGLQLILDYEYPEFYFPMNYPYMEFMGYDEYAGVIALKDRFYDEKEDLYESEGSESKILVSVGNSLQLKSVNVLEGDDTITAPENCYISVRYSYRDDIPEKLIEKQKATAVYDKALLNDLLKQAEENTDYFIGYEKNVHVDRIGNYYNFTDRTMYYKKDYWKEQTTCTLYDLDLNEVEISDLFQKGFDYESMIKEAIETSLKETYSAVDEESGEQVEELEGSYPIEELYDSLTVSLSVNRMFFYTKPIEVTMNGVESDYQSPLLLNLSYEDIGCDNLTIFH